jgi:hypothetical protein
MMLTPPPKERKAAFKPSASAGRFMERLIAPSTSKAPTEG